MEKLSRVLSDFAVEPGKMTRVRGGFLLETGDGLRLLQEYRGGTAKLAAVEALQRFLREQGFFRTDLLLRSKKGELSSRDVDGTVYVLKEWFLGQECSRENRGNLFAGMELLARLHSLTERTEFAAENYPETECMPQTEHNTSRTEHATGGAPSEDDSGQENRLAWKNGLAGTGDLIFTFEKRVRELRRARNFLKSRRQKTDFESGLFRYADYYIACGEKALERLRASGYEELQMEAVQNGTIVHGAYHYHNILILSSGAVTSEEMWKAAESRAAATKTAEGRQVSRRSARPAAAAVNFERMTVGIQITDVYDFVRKVLEKNDWSQDLGYRMMECYQREKPISENELEILRILFLFPEKYWKLVNFYFNHSKTWIPGKNPEKLATLVRQEEARIKFVEGI